jgi:hypothetical protein
MEIKEFRQRVHQYTFYLDASTFVNTLLDSLHKHHQEPNQLELILQDMEQECINYQKRLKEYAEGLKNSFSQYTKTSA